MTLPFDFLSVKFPQISIPGIKEIRVSTHVNFELKSDFIVEFAKSAVKPINRLNTDFSKIPTKIAPDINISTPPNINITPSGSTKTHRDDLAMLEKDILDAMTSLETSS